MEDTCTFMAQVTEELPYFSTSISTSRGSNGFRLDPSGKDVCFRQDVSLLTDSVLPRHFCLLTLGRSDDWLGDLVGHVPWSGHRRSTLAFHGFFFWNTHGFGWQGGGWLVEVIERRLVGEVVGVEVLVKVAVGLEIQKSICLVWWLWSSGQSQTHNLGWVSSSGGGVAATGRLFGSIQDVRLRYTVPDGLVGGV